MGGFFGVATFFGPVLLALALTVYPMAVTLPVRRWVGLLALLVPVVLAAHLGEAYLGALDPFLYAELVMAVAFAVLPALVALLRRSRREAVLRDREEDRRRTAYEERLRIAREVHDVVGHSLSVVTMQAGVALHVLDKQRAAGTAVSPEVSASLEAIRRSSRDALAELRTTLGMFRDPAGEPRTPPPGSTGWTTWSARCGAAGRRIDVVRPLDAGAAAGGRRPGRVPDRAGGPDQRRPPRRRGPATVRIDREPDGLVVEVERRRARRHPPRGGQRHPRHAGTGGLARWHGDARTGQRGGFLLRADLPLVAARPRGCARRRAGRAPARIRVAVVEISRWSGWVCGP